MKAVAKKIFIELGGEWFLRKRNSSPRVLFWHGVENNPYPNIEAESISARNFVKQIVYLEKHFEIISVDAFYARYQMNSFKGKEIVLTFDDGYKNNLSVIAPILKDRNLPFTVFVSTNNISKGQLFPTSILRLVVFGSNLKKLVIPTLSQDFPITDLKAKKNSAALLSELLKKSELQICQKICDDLIKNIAPNEWERLVEKYNSVKPLTWDEVRELKKNGCTIGSHCVDHICCHAKQEPEEVRMQILRSKKIIESELGVPCNYFAYPNGNFTPFSKDCVKQAGYLIGFSTNRNRIDPKKNQYDTMPRISVPFNNDTFKIIINLFPKKQ